MDSDEGSREVRLKVFEFFREHPVHAFRVDTIARHLELTDDEVQEAVAVLVGEDVLDLRFQLATAELAGIVDEMTREK